jgi:hypothetical protein
VKSGHHEKLVAEDSFRLHTRFRSGIGMFIVSWSVLTGTPITGALLGNGDPNSTEPGGGYRWSRAIIFSGVNYVLSSISAATQLMPFSD